MFHQFDVSETDRDVFGGQMVVLSSKSPRNIEWKCIRLGLFKRKKCTLQQQARCITHDFYVDDGLASVESAKQTKDLIWGACEICKKGSLHLDKFIANDCDVLKSVPESERTIAIILDLQSEELPIEKVLGIQWSVGFDCFGFSIILKDQPLTRRGVLATVASVYDPLGFLAPLVLTAKKILQEICRRGVTWDEPLPEDVRPRWE